MTENHMKCVLLISVLLLQFAHSVALPPPPATQTENPSQNHSKPRKKTITTITLVCFILAVACVFLYIHYHYSHVHRRGSMPHRTSSASGRGLLITGTEADSLDRDVINSFPTFIYSEVKAFKIGLGTGLECAVCLNEFEDDETLRLLPGCSHAFHSGCIDEWLSSHVTCPVCRAKVTDSSSITGSPDSGCDEYSVREARYSDAASAAVADHEFIVPSTRFTTKMGTLDIVPGGSGAGESVVIKPGEGEDWERFTLRLPEEVQSQLVRSRLNRTRSCVGFDQRARSFKDQYRSGIVGNGNGQVYKNFLYSDQGSDRSELTVASVSSRFSSTVSDGGGERDMVVDVNSD